jgi:YidC/Oxa1 family membrane protein insertase
MQKSNIVLFIVLSLTVILGWGWLQSRLWPRREAKAPPPKEALPSSGAIARVVSTPLGGLPGLADAFRFVGALADADATLFKLLPTVQAKLTPATRTALKRGTLLLGSAFPPSLAGWVALAQGSLEAQKARPPTPAQPRTIELGGPDYFIHALLSTKGGGVQSLTLTKFQAASREGRPVFLADGARAPLDLIPDDPVLPSFALYHFPDPGKPGETPPPPVTTLGETTWKLEGRSDNGEEQQVRFSAPVPGYDHLTLHRVYSLRKKDYHLGLTIEIHDERDPEGKGEVRPFRYQLAGPHGVPIEGEWYTYTYRNAVIGMVDSRNNLWRTLEDSRRISYREGGDRIPEGPRAGDFLQYAVVANQYFASGIVVDNKQPAADEGGVDPKGILAWARPTLETEEVRGRLLKVNLKTNEILVGMVQDKAEILRFCKLLPRARKEVEDLNLGEGDLVLVEAYQVDGQLVAGSIHHGDASRPFLDDVTVRVNSEIVELKPGETRAHRFLLYQGPIKVMLLGQFSGDEAVDPDLVTRYGDTLHLSTLTDYRSAGIFGSISQAIHFTDLLIFCTKLMHWLLYLLLLIVRNEGLSIILLTVIVRGLMFPISRKQALMSQKMQALAPELKKVQEKYKNDPQGRTHAMMDLYRKHGVNPLGGCLPLLLQMPIFLGLYWALQESIRFRLAPFLWIHNLAAPDMLIPWSTKIPWISDPNNMGGFLYLGPYFNVLPVLAVTLMLAVQKMMMPPAADEQQAMQQKMMKWMMILMGLFFYKVAAGLCLYFIASSAWGLAERKLLPKRQAALATAGGPAIPAGGKGTGPPTRGKAAGRGKARGKKAVEEQRRFQRIRTWWDELLRQAKKP